MRWRVGKQSLRTRTWDELQVFLDAQLRLVKQVPDRYLIISSRNANRYVQLASLKGGGVIGEAVSNHFLKAADRLSPTACRALCGMGWMLPHTSGWGNGNFWQRWADAAPTEEIATITVRSLRDVLDVASPAILEITTGEFAAPLTGVPPGISVHLDLRRGQRVRNEENGRAYLVGEQGPELFVPSSNGAIAPNAVPSRPSITLNVQARDAQSFLKSETQIAAMLSRALARGQRNM